MKMACLALTLTVSMSGAALAAPPLIDHWNSETITGQLRTLGVATVKDATLGGRPGLLANTADGLSFGLYAKACAPSATSGDVTCKGVEGVALFDASGLADPALLVDKLNHDRVSGKFMLERDGSIMMSRYVNLDGGVSPANLKAELADFLAVAAAAKQTVWNAPSR